MPDSYTTPPIDARYFLGPICKSRHEWGATGETLRYRSSRGCVACASSNGQRNRPRKPVRTTAERFWSKVARSGGCWLWTGARLRQGYGVFQVAGNAVKAHRFSYAVAYGAIPADMCVCHHCDTPACVRPDHLFLGTHGDNARDRDEKGRGATGARNGSRALPERLHRGSSVKSAKLTEERVSEIRRRYAAGERDRKALGREFDVTELTIGRVLNRTTWQHVA